MGEYSLSWEALEDALKNESACERYEKGYRAEEKETTEIERASAALKRQLNGGKIYGLVNTVQCR